MTSQTTESSPAPDGPGPAAMQDSGEPNPDETAERRRVLVAEDSSATQDLLKLVLSHRGHDIDIVDDGRAALEALRTKAYDVALLDYNMPVLNGLEVIAGYYGGDPAPTRPHFVAVTGDLKGLLASERNCERFDRVLGKPIDLDEVSAVIDELGPAVDAAEGAAPAAVAPAAPAAGASARRRSPVEELGYSFLRWPEDANPRALSRGAGARGFDAVLIAAPATAQDLAPVWGARGLHLAPVIDLTGVMGARADLDASALPADEVSRVADLVEAFAERRAALHPDLFRAETAEDKLLGRVHVSGAPLTPRRDGAERGLVGYNTILAPDALRPTARKLADRGLLEPTFFDRVHRCAACGSARFNVREECPDCGGARLDEVSYLHHFRCAFQGPEPDFRRGDDLICPKCRRELRHFGQDYDRPGMMVVCADCGAGTSEPRVGFVCVDCGAHADGDSVETRDVFAYRLTDQAVGYLEAGPSFLGFAQQNLRFADLPLDLVVALNAAAKRYNEAGAPFALLNIAYENERRIVREHGPRQFDQTRSLLLETLREGLGPGAKVVKGQVYDFALLPGAPPDAIRAEAAELQASVARNARLDPGALISVFGPEDIA